MGRFSLDEPLPFLSHKDTKEQTTDGTQTASQLASPMNVIQKRITQANKTKDKPALLKHVFSTYTKRRKIMVVKYKRPIHKIFDLDDYNEDTEDYSSTKDTPSKAKKSKVEESPAKLPPLKIPISNFKVDETSSKDESEEFINLESETNLDCHICKRSFPNRIRLPAHFQ